MKRFSYLLLALALIALVCAPADAYKGKARQDADQEVAAYKGYNRVVYEGYFNPSSSQTVTPANTTGTGAYTLGFCPTATVTEYPVKMVVQYLGTNKVYLTNYSATAAGIRATTATCSYLMDPGQATNTPQVGDEYEFMLFQAPAFSLGGGGSAATFTIRILGPDSDPYQ